MRLHAILPPVTNNDSRQTAPPAEFPRLLVFVRWLLLAGEAALAIFFVITFNQALGVFYIAYGTVCLFLLLPLIRCVRCAYYGRRCSFGWGAWVSKVFPRDETNAPDAFQGLTLLFWPLRALPILLGIISLMGGFMSRFVIVPHGLFGIYLLILLLHRLFYRARACPGCEMKASCPVYNGRPAIRNTQTL